MDDTSFLDTVPEEFWKTIEDANQDRTRFREALEKMDREAIARLYWTYEELADLLRTEDYVAHADPQLS